MGTRDALVIGYGEDRGMNTLNEDQRAALKTLEDKQES
jgi:hypothetical protein